MNEVNKELWALIDEFRGKRERFDLPEVIRVAKQREIKIDYSILRSLSRSLPNDEEYFFPERVPNFISSVLKDFHPRAVLDPWANTGSLLSPIVDFIKPVRALGITPVKSALEIAQLLSKDENITWKQGDPFNIIEDINEVAPIK